ncbi:MAG TPA: prepilin peptidase [Alphaproteobacteria bacterium]|nr:prepilin peptidase [Alphaproteobacteria bacterium]
MFLVLIKIIYVLINISIGVYDFSFYRIPNLLLGALLVLYGLSAPFYLSYDNILTSLVVFAVVLVVGLILYALKTIGGGDAKYLAIASLWAGFPGVVQLVFLIAFVGGGLAIIYLLLRDHVARLSDWVWNHIQKTEESFPILQSLWLGSGIGPEKGKRDNISSKMVPYGIAIAIGSIIMILLQPLTL